MMLDFNNDIETQTRGTLGVSIRMRHMTNDRLTVALCVKHRMGVGYYDVRFEPRADCLPCYGCTQGEKKMSAFRATWLPRGA